MAKPLPAFTKVLVTGASSGIGEALACLLAERGIALILHGRDRHRLQTLADKLSKKVPTQTLVADLGKERELQKVVEVIHAQVPDLVINSAGFGIYGETLSHTSEQHVEMVDVNAKALLVITLEAARALVAANRTGMVMNISSMADSVVGPLFTVYSATKAFVTQFSESLDFELKPQGVRVLVALPGQVETHFQERAAGYHHGDMSSPISMTPEFAAQKILRQIDTKRRVYTFHWINRYMRFLVRYVLPKPVVAAIMRQVLVKRVRPK